MENKSHNSNLLTNPHNEGVVLLKLSKLKPFEEQPFKVLLDDSMTELVQSISERGVLTPIVVRPHKEEGYEILSGHRRVKACELAGRHKIPAFIRELDDDKAAIFLVDSNLQRENLLPSEKAYAYRMKMEALKHQGFRIDLTSSQIGTRLRTDEVVANEAGESRSQLQRYIRLTNLIDKLLDKVDEKKIPVNAAVELSYLDTKSQVNIADIIEYDEVPVSVKQAKLIRQSAEDGKTSLEEFSRILNDKTEESASITIKDNKIRKYFPESYSKKQMLETIYSLLEEWSVRNGGNIND